MKERDGEHPFGDAGQAILFFIFLTVWAGDSFFLRKSTSLSECVPLWIRLIVLGIALTVASYLFVSGHVVVSHDQRLTGIVSAGAFCYVRHPLYLGTLLFYLGLAISTASLVSLGLLVVIIVFYNYIAGYEEKLLEVRFGGAYRSYKERTGKWLPRLTRRN